MSFTAEVKDELSRVPATCSHCDKAVLAALVRIEGTLFVSGKNRYRVEIATDAPSVARLVIKLLHELYRLKTNLTVRRSVLHKTPNYLIEVPAQPQLAAALVRYGRAVSPKAVWCSVYPSSWWPRIAARPHICVAPSWAAASCPTLAAISISR